MMMNFLWYSFCTLCMKMIKFGMEIDVFGAFFGSTKVCVHLVTSCDGKIVSRGKMNGSKTLLSWPQTGTIIWKRSSEENISSSRVETLVGEHKCQSLLKQRR